MSFACKSLILLLSFYLVSCKNDGPNTSSLASTSEASSIENQVKSPSTPSNISTTQISHFALGFPPDATVKHWDMTVNPGDPFEGEESNPFRDDKPYKKRITTNYPFASEKIRERIISHYKNATTAPEDYIDVSQDWVARRLEKTASLIYHQPSQSVIIMAEGHDASEIRYWLSQVFRNSWDSHQTNRLWQFKLKVFTTPNSEENLKLIRALKLPKESSLVGASSLSTNPGTPAFSRIVASNKDYSDQEIIFEIDFREDAKDEVSSDFKLSVETAGRSFDVVHRSSPSITPKVNFIVGLTPDTSEIIWAQISSAHHRKTAPDLVRNARLQKSSSETDSGKEFYVKVFQVPPDFIERIEPESSEDDPFRYDSEPANDKTKNLEPDPFFKKKLKGIFENMGVEFTEGSYCMFIPETSILLVHHTIVGIDQITALIKGGGYEFPIMHHFDVDLLKNGKVIDCLTVTNHYNLNPERATNPIKQLHIDFTDPHLMRDAHPAVVEATMQSGATHKIKFPHLKQNTPQTFPLYSEDGDTYSLRISRTSHKSKHLRY